MSDAKQETKAADQYRIPANSPWASAWKKAAAVGVVGLVLAGAGFANDSERFAFSWLMGFASVMTLALGTLFFVLVQHLTGAGWSVTVRRSAEFFLPGMPVLVLLFAPNLMSLDTLYPWWSHDDSGTAHAQPAHEGEGQGEPAAVVHGQGAGAAHAALEHGAHHSPEHAAHEEVLEKKLPFLNSGFFFARMVLYFLIWIWIGAKLFKFSTAQDQNGDPQWTVKAQRFAPPATILFALSLTFAGFDWLMSLIPNWYSTMFGVRVFASSAVLGLAVVVLITSSFKNSGLVKNEINIEHFHDLGKLMFGFLVFWAYISFSEFMLIWYAALPEETIYYHLRWDDPLWRAVSVGIVTVKFIIPFFFIMSRNIKRKLSTLRAGAAWIAALHLLEMYYWVMPHYYDKVHGGHMVYGFMDLLMDAGCFMACIGIYLAFVFKRMLAYPVIPTKDPRLQRALEFVNA